MLLILATVSIQVLTGDNGLLTKTETAVQSNKDSQEEEKVKLAVSAAQLAGNGTISTDNLNSELRSNFDDNNISVEEKSEGWLFKRNREYTIYMNGKVEEGDLIILPKEYQRVEYIESTGTQYIDTGVIPKATLNGEFDLMSIDGGYPFGSTNGQDTDYWGMNFHRGDNTFQLYLGTGNYPLVSSWKKDIRYKISINNKKFYCDDNFLYDFSQTSNGLNFNTNKSIYLFALNYNGVSYSKFRFYAAKFFDDNVLIRDYIPCYRKSDYKAGLYDLENNQFYTNQGIEDFKLPSEVEKEKLLVCYQEVEYIESTGTQYIDTGYKLSSLDQKVVLNARDVDFSQSSATGMFGAGVSGNTNVLILYANNNNTLGFRINTNGYGDVSIGNKMNSKRFELIISKGNAQLKYDDNIENYNYNSLSVNPNLNCYLFWYNRPNENTLKSSFKLENFKIYNENEELVRNFIPCKRIIDNKPGLYDLVNNLFYTNQGTGDDFIAGPDV